MHLRCHLSYSEANTEEEPDRMLSERLAVLRSERVRDSRASDSPSGGTEGWGLPRGRNGRSAEALCGPRTSRPQHQACSEARCGLEVRVPRMDRITQSTRTDRGRLVRRVGLRRALVPDLLTSDHRVDGARKLRGPPSRPAGRGPPQADRGSRRSSAVEACVSQAGGVSGSRLVPLR
jgi:hypothetical protein